MCSFRDPAFTARSKGLLAGINYIPGLLCLPDYSQLLPPQPREGEAPTAPPPSSRREARGDCKCHWRGRHFIPAVLVPMALLVTGLPAEHSLGRREEKRKKQE